MRLSWKCLAAGLMVLSMSSMIVQADETMEAGTVRTDEKGIEQVWVPAGCYTRGTNEADFAKLEAAPSWAEKEKPAESPAHEVCITKGFWIDKYEVTNASFQKFFEDGGYTKEEYWSEKGWKWLSMRDIKTVPAKCENEAEADHPRACITWYEAEAYAAWRGGRLPSAAEWEYAARGPESLVYPWGNEWDSAKANVVDSEHTTAVGSFPDGVSWVGAHDMAGNVMEWVNDWYSTEYYKEGVKDDPTGPEKGSTKIEKGGWFGSNPFVSRAAYGHYEDGPYYQDHHIGVRVVTSDNESK